MARALIEKIAPAVHAQTGGVGTDFACDELWSDPRNLVGTPQNRIIDRGMLGPILPESSNFELAIPVLTLPGRGLDLNLTLYYNSQVWSRHGNAVRVQKRSGLCGRLFARACRPNRGPRCPAKCQ